MDSFSRKGKETGGKKGFFWNPERYYKENVYHIISFAAWVLAGIFFVVLIFVLVFLGILGIVDIKKMDEKNPPLYFIIPCAIIFCLILTGLVTKMSERKIRKQRKLDLASASSRDIDFK